MHPCRPSAGIAIHVSISVSHGQALCFPQPHRHRHGLAKNIPTAAPAELYSSGFVEVVRLGSCGRCIMSTPVASPICILYPSPGDRHVQYTSVQLCVLCGGDTVGDEIQSALGHGVLNIHSTSVDRDELQ